MEIVKQLKQIVIILFIFAIVNISLLSCQSYQLTKDSRILTFLELLEVRVKNWLKMS